MIHLFPDLCIHVSHPRSPPPAPQENGGKGILKGLSEVVSHEGVNQRVDGGVGVRHAVTPNLQLGGGQNQYRLISKAAVCFTEL